MITWPKGKVIQCKSELPRQMILQKSLNATTFLNVCDMVLINVGQIYIVCANHWFIGCEDCNEHNTFNYKFLVEQSFHNYGYYFIIEPIIGSSTS